MMKCSQGHYYDKDKYVKCPFCAEDQIGHMEKESQSAGDMSFSDFNDPEDSSQALSSKGYELIEEIGKGATGRVFKVRRIRDNSVWAAKEIKKSLDPKLQYTIRQETSLLNNVYHPNIERIEEVIETDHAIFIIMTYIEGKTIRNILREYGHFSIQDTAVYASQICDAMEYLHERHLIYQDLNPSNIIITPDKKAMIIDFGSVRQISPDREDEEPLMMGTVPYAAPEQFKAAINIDIRAVVFSLGKIIDTMLSGSYTIGSDVLIGEKIPELQDTIIEQIIFKSTRMNPQERYDSCEQMRKELLEVIRFYNEESEDDKSEESEYDVFISFKHTDNGEETQDCRMAEELFQFLTAKGIRPFFSKESLITMGVGNYLSMIETAVEQSKVLVIVGTSKEHLCSNWLLLEYSMYVSNHENSRINSVFLYISKEMQPQRDLPGAFRLYSAYQKKEDVVKIVENRLYREKERPRKKTAAQILRDARNLRKVTTTGYVLDGRYLFQELVKYNEYYDQYVAQDLRLKKKCVIKIFFKGLVPENRKEELRKFVENEREILMRLRCDGIPKILDYVNTELYYAIVTDYFDGVSLENMKMFLGKIPEEMAVNWIMKLCRLLLKLHSSTPAVYHCNIKPSNILIGEDGQIELINFSAAVMAGSKTILPRAFSRRYMDTFGIRSKPGVKTDIYALGCTMLDLLGETMAAERYTESERLSHAALSKGIRYVIRKCLEQPADRYNSCYQIMKDLGNLRFINFKEEVKEKALTIKGFFSLSGKLKRPGSFSPDYILLDDTETFDTSDYQADEEMDWEMGDYTLFRERRDNLPNQTDHTIMIWNQNPG